MFRRIGKGQVLVTSKLIEASGAPIKIFICRLTQPKGNVIHKQRVVSYFQCNWQK